MTGLRGWLLDRLWYVQPMTALTVKALPNDCSRTLALATRPNLDRLHLRNLFIDGRRYYVSVLNDGFEMTTHSSLPWRPKTRGSIAAVLRGTFSAAGNDSTVIRMQARMRLLYLLNIFPIPLFMTALLIASPWSKTLVIGLIIGLFFLSWAGHRLTASLQAADMVYFVEKVLEEVITTDTPLLSSNNESVVTPEQDFPKQWQKFYEEHKGES
ncbi:MAG: hypothetical protein GC179_10720 [Anaerolineaceae bacterium]|nr:hypothetical protein [Anaerolineaceae bacterium]